MKTLSKVGITVLMVILLSALPGAGNCTLQAQAIRYANPAWAPAYYPGVRYYYIPDIETYYDLINQDFVYLDDGSWMFSYGLPPMYSGFDLYGAFVVALDIDVFQPWMHHQYYLSHYPRYYYRSVYGANDIRNIRGFNENLAKVISVTDAERIKMNELRRSAPVETRTQSSRPAQTSHYYGPEIGQPVRVQEHMREGYHGTERR